MDYWNIIIISLITSPFVQTRGPHHPRGESIVKLHVHYRPTKGVDTEKLTQDTQLLHDKEHIREDVGEWMQEKDLDSMTDEELEFHYFNMHDSDKNTFLDGLEILQAMQHTVEHSYETKELENENHVELYENDFNFFVELIDKVFEEDDLDDDGFLSYAEYVNAMKRGDKDKVFNEGMLTVKPVT